MKLAFVDPRPGCKPKNRFTQAPHKIACNRLCMEGGERCPHHAAMDAAKAAQKAAAPHEEQKTA